MKALVIRFSAIGDCVMAVPVANSIRTKYPDAQIVWAVEPQCAPVIDTDCLVNELKLFPRDQWEAHRWSPSTWRSQLRTYAGMRNQNFDIAIDLQGQAKTAICLRIANAKKRIAVRGHDTLSKKLNPILEIPRGQMHTLEHSMLALSRLGDFSTEIRFAMPKLIEEKKKLRALKTDKPLATISVSAGQPKKLYPPEQWTIVAEGLKKRGFQVAFLGGPKDVSIPMEGVYDWVGQFSLREAMAAVAVSDVHLAADTGTGHMAAAYNVPVVSVFGRTKPYWFRPYTTNGVVLDGQGSMLNVTPEQVLEATSNLLAKHSEAISS